MNCLRPFWARTPKAVLKYGQNEWTSCREDLKSLKGIVSKKIYRQEKTPDTCVSRVLYLKPGGHLEPSEMVEVCAMEPRKGFCTVPTIKISRSPPRNKSVQRKNPALFRERGFELKPGGDLLSHG
jgi:hypothetical protein